jgi:Secretion system C-terminal sorting domain/Endonuclease/Exonuclease/phosphatase family
MNHSQKVFSLIVSFFFTAFSLNFAQTLALWEFDSQTTATSTPTNGTVTAAAWSTGTITYPAGNTSVTTDKAISTTGFNSASLNTAKYLQFTVSPNANFAMSLTSIGFYDQKSATGPSNWVLRSSLDGYVTDLNLPTPGTTSAAFAAIPQTIDLGLGFQNITTSVTFRLYAYGASGSTGTWRLDDLAIDGNIIDVSNPAINTSKTAISFTTISVGTPSVAKSFITAGFGLTNNLVITPPNGYEVSLSESNGYASSLTLPPSSGRVASTLIYVRLTGTMAGNFNSNLALTSVGVPTRHITLSGNVIVQPTRQSIATVRGSSTGTNVFTGGRVTVATEFGPNQIFIQDVTGGISIYNGSANLGLDYGLQLGDSVEVFGYKSAFNNLDQITVLTFTKISTPQYNPPALVISQADLAAHEGELVTVQNIQFPGTGGNYTVNTNYAFGFLPVRILSTATPSNNIVGSAVQSATGNITGISGVYGTNLQLYPRSTADFMVTGSGITDATFQDNNALDVVAWNVSWFGSPANGPADLALQAANVKTVITTINADIYEFEEVSDSVGFMAMIASIGGYSCKCSPEYSYSNTPSADIYGQRLCFAYKNSVFTNVSTKPLLTAYKNDTTLLPDYPNTRTRFWASGRLPYLLTANVTLNGTTRFMGFLGVHARANTAANAAQEVYDMRKYDVEKLKTYMDAAYPNLPYIMSGDFNDDLDETVANVTTSISTYNAYINDPANYSLFTLALSKAGAKSTTGFTDMIDHIIGSNEMSSSFLAARVGSPQTYIASYGTKTSDHYPIMAKFNLPNVPIIPVELLSFDAYLLDNKNVELNWSTASERNADYFNIEKSTDGKVFNFIKKIKAVGLSNQKNDYHYTDFDDSDNKILYYRLKQVDDNGKTEYSKTVSVAKKQSKTQYVVYPNPAKTAITIEGLTPIKTVQIYNAQGILVKTTQQNKVSISDFPTGIYVLMVENTEGGISQTKFVKN